MPTPNPSHRPTAGPRSTPAQRLLAFTAFTPAERELMITEHAAGSTVRQISTALGRPATTVNDWLTRHGLHTPRRRPNHLVRQLALILVSAGMTQADVAALINVTRQTVCGWANRFPTPARPEDAYDEATISFYRALLSGATPATAAASTGRPLSQLDPDGVYSSDVNTAVADQITVDTPKRVRRQHAADQRQRDAGRAGRRQLRRKPGAALRPVAPSPAPSPAPVAAPAVRARKNPPAGGPVESEAVSSPEFCRGSFVC